MHVDKRLDLNVLEAELIAAGVPVSGLGFTPDQVGAVAGDVFTYAPDPALGGALGPTDMPPGSQPVVDAHVAPPVVTEFVGSQQVNAIVRTTDAQPLEVFRFACLELHAYEATLVIRGIDAGNFAWKRMLGEFAWKRATANAVVTGVTVVSDLHDTAAAGWVPNFGPSGTDIVFTVQGAAGRTIDWALTGTVGAYAPAGL